MKEILVLLYMEFTWSGLVSHYKVVTILLLPIGGRDIVRYGECSE